MVYCKVEFTGTIVNTPNVKIALKSKNKWTFLKVKTENMYIRVKVFGDDAEKVCERFHQNDFILVDGTLDISTYGEHKRLDIACYPTKIEFIKTEQKTLQIN